MDKLSLAKPDQEVASSDSEFSQQDTAALATIDVGQGLPQCKADNSSNKTMACSLQDTPSCPGQEQLSNTMSEVLSGAEKMSPEQWCDRVGKTPKTVLREQFPQEANSHRNMKRRGATKGFVIHPAFKEFKSFLLIMGAAPTKTATIDRIDPHDPEYAPGKVRWADKTTQASNKTNTIIINDPDTGKAWTIVDLAKHRGVSPDALRKQRARGASDRELIHGKPSSSLSAPSEPAPTSKQAYLDSGPRPLYSEHVDIHLIGRSALWMAIADKFPPTWRDVNYIEWQLFEWFPAIKACYFDLNFIPPKRVSYPKGRWKQLFDMFPIDIEHLNAVNDYFFSERVPGGRAIVETRRREERRALAQKEVADRQKWEEWEYVCSVNLIPDLTAAAGEHLLSLGEHPFDAWNLYREMQSDEEVRALDFEAFVMRLQPDEGDTSSEDWLRRSLDLEVAPMPFLDPDPDPDPEIKDLDGDFDPTDCAAPAEVDDEDEYEDEDGYVEGAVRERDDEGSDAFDDAFWRSAEGDEED